MAKFRGLPIFFILLVSLAIITIVPVWANTDTSGTAAGVTGSGSGYVYAVPVTVTGAGTVQTVGINWAGTPAGGNVEVALYSAGSGKPASLLTNSASVAVATGAGWQDIPVAAYSVVAGSYWLAFAFSQDENGGVFYYSTGMRVYYAKSYGAFDFTWSSSSGGDGYNYNLRITYSTGPPPSDFTITTSQPSSQTISAGVNASYSLNIQYSATLTTTVNLVVTSGCPTGMTCTITPNSVTGTQTVTLSVPTQLVTTGTFSIIVTASSTSPILSHSVTVQLIVNGPATFPITVHAGATQVIVTVSWTGSGTAPVTLAGPSNSPLISETAAVVYDRTSIPSGSSTPTYLHRVTFTLKPSPSTTQTWTAYVSVSVTGGYTITTEVS